MADDEFEIDIYGDSADGGDDASKRSDPERCDGDGSNTDSHVNAKDGDADKKDGGGTGNKDGGDTGKKDNEKSQPPILVVPRGLKRKADEDMPASTTGAAALLISEIAWWITEENIRMWVNKAESYSELIGITFNEHKVNGKSKGYATASPLGCMVCQEALAVLWVFADGVIARFLPLQPSICRVHDIRCRDRQQACH
jgi:hypothetical protein